MAIPERLKLQPLSEQVLREMSALCAAIERELEFSGEADDLLKRWHTRARRRCEPYDFQTYWKSMDVETFVNDALNPEPSFDGDATYPEALAVLDVVLTAMLPEAENFYYLQWLEAQFPGSNMSDLIYWPDEWFGDATLFRDADGAFRPEVELSNEEILAYAMAKSGRKLKDAPNGIVMPFPLPRAK